MKENAGFRWVSEYRCRWYNNLNKCWCWWSFRTGESFHFKLRVGGWYFVCRCLLSSLHEPTSRFCEEIISVEIFWERFTCGYRHQQQNSETHNFTAQHNWVLTVITFHLYSVTCLELFMLFRLSYIMLHCTLSMSTEKDSNIYVENCKVAMRANEIFTVASKNNETAFIL